MEAEREMGRERGGGGELINRINQLGRQKKEEKSGGDPFFLSSAFCWWEKKRKNSRLDSDPISFPARVRLPRKAVENICTCEPPPPVRIYYMAHFYYGNPQKRAPR